MIERDAKDGYPKHYHDTLEKIKASLDTTSSVNVMPLDDDLPKELVVKNHFHHEFFDSNEIESIEQEIKDEILQKCSDTSKLYHVAMQFDDDLYARGYNHIIFFKLFENIGKVLKSFWYFDENTPALDDFNTQTSFIKKVSVYLLSEEPLSEIEDVFEFIAEDNEVGISIVDCDLFIQKELQEEPQEEVTFEASESVEQEEIQEEKETIEPTNKPEPKVQQKEDQNEVKETIAKPTVSKSIRIESGKLDELFDSIGELVIAQSFIDQNVKIKDLNDPEINQYLSMLNKTTRLIQNKVMNLRMVPIRDTFLKMKRVTRDVSKKTGKDVELILSGEDTEIDKTMIDSLSEPLIHLIRNSIDHGIEANEEARLAVNKPATGVVNLSAMHKGSSFIIEIKDDGRGIDAQSILQKAIAKGLANENQEYSNEEIYNFLFAAGFSTAERITDVSGRGVGLDAVKKSIESIKGKLQVESTLGKGSTFRIVLPLTLAIIDGLSVQVKDEVFIVPTLSVVESFRAKPEQIQKAKAKGEFLNFRGDILPILQLGKPLEIDDRSLDVENSTMICIEHERGRYILQVDELLGRQQVVIKSLSKRLSNVKEISGAAIMGSGDIALILNIEGIRDWLDTDK